MMDYPVPSLKLTARTWKWMVGILVSLLGWPISRGKLFSFRECNQIFILQLLDYWSYLSNWDETCWPLDGSTHGKLVAANFQLLGTPGWLKCWIRGTTNPQTYHVTLSKINSLNLKNWKWWFGSDDFPFPVVYSQVPSRSSSGVPWEKENHLQNAILGGYVRSLEGITCCSTDPIWNMPEIIWNISFGLHFSFIAIYHDSQKSWNY